MTTIFINPKQDKQINDGAHQLNHSATITNIETWQSLLDCYLQIKQEVVPKRVFLVLDDVHQAEYTSMHTTHNKPLYFDDAPYLGHIYANDQDFEYVYANVVSLLSVQHYTQQFKQPEHQKTFDDLSKKMRHYNADDLITIIRINENPLPVMDQEMSVKVAEVESEVLKFAWLPNGYFVSDFDPFENFAIIQRMQHYGFEFIGLGAALLGWIKTPVFKDATINGLIQDLSLIYHFDLETQNAMKELILKNNYLILPYTESPQEYLDYYS
ncbi:MAG: hypothetical protein KAZ18_04775 [Acinetobacter sp.]|nr:hypothetical protein [Acinetobacter sp.]